MSSNFRSCLAQLPERPSGDDLTPVVEVLARLCQQRTQPRKSLAMHIRNAAHSAPAKVLEAIASRVTDLLERGSPPPAAPVASIGGTWMTISEAARILGLQRATLTDRLRDPQYRYLYGWPHWDGHQWWFSSAAVDPETRVGFLSRLPKSEPDAHANMLPEWCARQSSAESKTLERAP